MGVDTGIGATIGFGTTVFLADVKSINGNTIREIIGTSHLGTTTARTFINATSQEPGQLTVGIEFDPGVMDTTPIPISAVNEAITITFPKMTGQDTAAIMVCDGFVAGYKAHIEGGQLMSAELTVQLSGEPLWTDSVAE